jgi:hypothetical protein
MVDGNSLERFPQPQNKQEDTADGDRAGGKLPERINGSPQGSDP